MFIGTLAIVVAMVAQSGLANASEPIAPKCQGLNGMWRGEIADKRGQRPLFLNVSTDAKGKLVGTLNLQARSTSGRPLGGFQRNGQQVEFTLPLRRFQPVYETGAMWGVQVDWDDASYAGTLSTDGSTIKGLFWSHGGQSTPVNFMCRHDVYGSPRHS